MVTSDNARLTALMQFVLIIRAKHLSQYVKINISQVIESPLKLKLVRSINSPSEVRGLATANCQIHQLNEYQLAYLSVTH
jgi:hypothetical protein